MVGLCKNCKNCKNTHKLVFLGNSKKSVKATALKMHKHLLCHSDNTMWCIFVTLLIILHSGLKHMKMLKRII